MTCLIPIFLLRSTPSLFKKFFEIHFKMTGSFDEVMQRLANSDPCHNNVIDGGQDAIGEKLMSLLRGGQLSPTPSDPEPEEDRGPRSKFNGLPTEDDTHSAASAMLTGSGHGHIDYPRDRILALNASSSSAPPTLPPGLKSKLNLYPAMRPKRATPQMEEVQLPEVRKFRKKTQSLTQTAIDLPVLPNGMAFTYDPVLGVWIPRSRPEGMKAV